MFKNDVEFEPSVMHVEGFVGNHTHFPLFDSGTMSFIFAAKSMSTLEEDKSVHRSRCSHASNFGMKGFKLMEL